MIKLLTEPPDRCLEYLCKKHIFGIRVLSNIHAYQGYFDFFKAWVQLSGENITAVFCLYDGIVTLYADACADYEEIAAFIRMLGDIKIYCNGENFDALGLSVLRDGYIMRHFDQGLLKSADLCGSVDFSCPYKEVYDILSVNSGSAVYSPEYDVWYADINHKIRHDISKMAVMYKDNCAVSCGLILANERDFALLGGIATPSEYRGNGYGGLIVSALVRDALKNKKVPYLFRDTGKNMEFYNHLGFEDVGKWAFGGI